MRFTPSFPTLFYLLLELYPPGSLFPFHLLSINSQKLIQLCEKLRGRWAVIFLSKNEADAFGSGGDEWFEDAAACLISIFYV